MRALALLLIPVVGACGGDSGRDDAPAGPGGAQGGGQGGLGGGADGGGGDAGGGAGVGDGAGGGDAGGLDGDGAGDGAGDGGDAGGDGGADVGGDGGGDAGGDQVFEPGWVASGLAWRGSVCPADPSAVQRDVGLILLRRRDADGLIAATGPNDSIGACQLTAGAGEGCLIGAEDFKVLADRIVDPGGFCAEAEGCVYPMDKELPVSAMDLRPAAGGTSKLALVFDGSGRVDGIGEDGLAEPGRAADRHNRRIAAAKGLLGLIGNTDDVGVWVASGDGPQAVRELGAFTTDRGATEAALDGLTPADVNPQAPLNAAIGAAVAAGATAVVLFTAGPATDTPAGAVGVPLAVVHLDNPAVRGGPAGTLWDLAQLACDSDGSYVRVEAADELSAEFNDAPLRVGGYADLVVDLSTALGDQGVPQGADVSLFLNVEVKVAGEVLMLDDISLPIRIP